MSATTQLSDPRVGSSEPGTTVVAPRRAAPVDDRRTGSPAKQLRLDLLRFRAVGRPFDEAWSIAYKRIRWPHHTAPKAEWKAILGAQRHLWREAYERQAPASAIEATGKLRAA